MTDWKKIIDRLLNDSMVSSEYHDYMFVPAMVFNETVSALREQSNIQKESEGAMKMEEKDKMVASFKVMCDIGGFKIEDRFLNWLDRNGFFDAPASTKYHCNYPGGLYDHSSAVYLRLKKLTEDNRLTWQRPESPFIIGMFHDLCKIDQYKIKDEVIKMQEDYPDLAHDIPIEYEYNNNVLLKGHGSKSVMVLSQFIPLTEEEMLCIRYHMGAYETDDWSEFDRAIKKYPNVLWTHQADMLASKVDDK